MLYLHCDLNGEHYICENSKIKTCLKSAMKQNVKNTIVKSRH